MRRFLALVSLAAVFVGCSRHETDGAAKVTSVYEPVRIVSAYIPLVEKPDARSALLIGDEARSLTNYLSRAGVSCSTSLGKRFDLVVVACDTMSWASCEKACAALSDDGALVWILDIAGLSFGELWDRVNEFALPHVHYWMPGSDRWVLVGRRTAPSVRLSDGLDVFAREGAFEDLAKARCGTLPEVFAGYLGGKDDVLPAFRLNDANQAVRTECFYTKDPAAVDWLVAEGVDRDISSSVFAEIRSLQVVRRLAVKGGMLASAAHDKSGEEEAASVFERVLKRNPNELLVLERLDRLARNAEGFMQIGKVLMAMKCYETMVLIRPDDPTAVHNFGMCLKKIGKLDLAEKILARAKSLRSRQEADE